MHHIPTQGRVGYGSVQVPRLGGKEVARRWEGGCGKFVLIQSGGGDCFHRYIGGITALPSHHFLAAKQPSMP